MQSSVYCMFVFISQKVCVHKHVHESLYGLISVHVELMSRSADDYLSLTEVQTRGLRQTRQNHCTVV